MTVSCDKASKLTSLALDRKLTPTEFVGLWIHRAICAPCRIYRKQMQTLHQQTRTLGNSSNPGGSMDGEAKERMRKRMRDAMRSSESGD